MEASSYGPDGAAGPATAGNCAQFAQECQSFITKNAGRAPNEPATVQDISSLVHLMKCMFTCFAPAIEAATHVPQLVAELKQTREEVKVLRDKFTRLSTSYNDAIRYSYDYNALVHGVAECDNESPESLCKSVLHVIGRTSAKPKASDLVDVHRLGTRQPGKTRPIVCRFLNRSLKHRVVGEFYRKRKADQAAAGNPEAARSIRSPVTNHLPFKRLIDIGDFPTSGRLDGGDTRFLESKDPLPTARMTRRGPSRR